MSQRNPGPRLRRFREEHRLSLREAARQLHVKHPALKDWEDSAQIPTQPYREAVEVWTCGLIKASDWPPTIREREIIENAGRVRPVVPAADSSTNLIEDAPLHSRESA